MLRLAFLIILVTVFCLQFAVPEPPPRSERAPASTHPGQRPAFMATEWRPSYPIPKGWRPRYFHYETRYRLKEGLYGPELETYADGTDSWIAKPLPMFFEPEQETCINWAWSADELPTLSHPETSLMGDDFAIRLYVFGDLENGEDFGFNYVWTNTIPRGDIWKSPWSTNKIMALRRGPNDAGKLVWESRNLTLDLETALGMRPALVKGIAIMSDAGQSNSVSRARITIPEFGPCNLAIS